MYAFLEQASATPFQQVDRGMGLISLENKQIVLFGGMRSGGSPAGTVRLKYVIYRTPDLEAGNQVEMGIVELFVLPGKKFDFAGLVNIELKKEARGQDLGSWVVKDLLATVKHDINIHDIKGVAVPFWKKLGVTLPDGSPLKRKARQHGVLKYNK